MFPNSSNKKRSQYYNDDEEKVQTVESGKEKVVNIALMKKEDMPREEFQTEIVSLSFVF